VCLCLVVVISVALVVVVIDTPKFSSIHCFDYNCDNDHEWDAGLNQAGKSRLTSSHARVNLLFATEFWPNFHLETSWPLVLESRLDVALKYRFVVNEDQI